jgi:hypothetical protein
MDYFDLAFAAAALLVGFIFGLLVGARETLALRRIAIVQYGKLALLADLARELSKALQHRREEYPHSLLSQCDEDLIGRADLLIKSVSRGVL